MSRPVVSVLTPIALRTPPLPTEEHPLQPLKLVAADIRTEATGRAEKLGRLLESIEQTMLTFVLVRDAGSMQLDQRQAVLLRAELEESLRSLPDTVLTLKSLLAESSATKAIPELRTLQGLLHDFSGQITVAGESQTLLEASRTLSKRSKEIVDRVVPGFTAMAVLLEHLSPETAKPLAITLSEILGNWDDSKQHEDMARFHKELSRFCKDQVRQGQLSREDSQIVRHIVKLNRSLSKLEIQQQARDQAMAELHNQSKQIYGQIFSIFANPVLQGIHNGLDVIQDRFIQESARSAVRPHLDPVSANNSTYDTSDRLPEKLRAVALGLGVDVHGALASVSAGADPSVLVQTVASLMETRDPSIYNARGLKSRLAPVIRAAIRDARDLVRQRADNRRENEARDAQAVQDARDFVALFFDDELSHSLPNDPGLAASNRETFLTLYPDGAQIERRSEKIKHVATSLSISTDYLATHYEPYLLAEKDFERWVQQAEKLKDHVYRNFDENVMLVMNDPSNFLPSALPDTIKTLEKGAVTTN